MRVEIRSAIPGDLAAILALTAEDSMHYFDEPAEITENQRAAIAEIVADPSQDLLVGELEGAVVCTAQVTWMRMLSADGGLSCQVEAVRTSSARRGSNVQRERAHAFYERLGFVASHVGMKKQLP